jgi:hypothetical protein
MGNHEIDYSWNYTEYIPIVFFYYYSNMEGSFYVDDFLICYRSKDMNIIERQLQLCLNKIEK